MSARYTPSRLLHFSNEGDEKPFCHLDKRIHSEKSDFFKSLLLTSGLTLNDFFLQNILQHYISLKIQSSYLKNIDCDVQFNLRFFHLQK